MEDLNSYMPKKEDTLTAVRAKVQNIINLKEELLPTLKEIKVIDVFESNDIKKISNSYMSAVNAFSILLDLIVDTKNEIFKIKLIKSRLNISFPDGLKQSNVIDTLLSLLYDIISILEIEKQSIDRIVRYYEKMSQYN